MKNNERINRKEIRMAAAETRRRKTWGQSLQVESLEARQMMAGDVSVSVNGSGDVFVVGDGADNDVDIATDLLSGDLVISGNAGTTITFDGATMAAHTIMLETGSTLDRNLTINMRGGNDSVSVGELDVVNNVTAILGGGDDAIDFSNGTYGKLSVRGGGGNDNVSVTAVDVEADAAFVMNGGDDTVALDTVTVGDDLTATSVEGANAFNALTVDVVDELWVSTGRASDAVVFDGGSVGARASINARGGDDSVSFLNTTVTGSLLAILGGGIDALTVQGSTIGDGSRVLAGGGNDALTMNGSTADGELTVVTGGGDDTVDVVDSTFRGSTLVSTGGGDDTISFTGTLVSNSSFAADVQLNGGFGADEVNGTTPDFTIEADLISIETTNLVAPI